MSEWIMDALGPDVPLHFSAFHPDWKMQEVPPTPPLTLSRAREIANGAGLHYVDTGNVHDAVGGTTHCPSCSEPLIIRDWYEILGFHVSDEGMCSKCGGAIAGRFGHYEGAYGNHRMPIKLSD